MTNKEAIEILLKHGTTQLNITGDTELLTAITMAVEALSSNEA